MSALSEQVKHFLAETKRLRTPVTYEQYRHALGPGFLDWCEVNQIREARLLTDDVMERYAGHLMSSERTSTRGSVRPLSAASVGTYLRIVQVFRHAHGVEGKYTVPRSKKSNPDPLSDLEFDRLKAAASDPHDELLVTLIWETGLQAGELLRLRKMDLREEPGPRTHLRIAEGRRERNVPVPPDLYERLKAFGSGSNTAPIFLATTGPRSRLNRLGRIVNDLATSAGVRRTTEGRSGISPKLLRVSFAARWLNRGGNPVVLTKILGHNSLEMVDRHYIRLVDRDPFSEMMRLKSVDSVLDALARPGYAGALEEFRTALDRAREGRTKDAAGEASKALESTVKCICRKRGWSYPEKATAQPLFRVLVDHDLLPDWMEGAFIGVATIRNKAMAAHGQGVEPKPLPQHMADLAVNLAANHIIMLIAADDALARN